MKKFCSPFKPIILAVLFYVCPSIFAAETNVIQLETITVTARQWEESSIDAPVSTTLVTAEEIDKSTSDIDIVLDKTANVALEDSGVQTRLSIRGLTGIDNGLQDPVGYFVNDVALPLGGYQAVPLFNLQSVEIVKGPQGTLYGRNTEAGALKINTAEPTWDFTNWFELSAGVEDGADGYAPTNVVSAGASNTLIEDKLAGNIAIRLEDTQGPYLNNYDDDTSGGEVEQLNLSTGFTYFLSDDTDISFKSVIEESDLGRNSFRYLSSSDAYETDTNFNGSEEKSSAIHSFKINHSFDNMELVAITGFTDFERDFELDADATSSFSILSSLDLEDEALSQEVRLSSESDDGRLKWLGGVYVYSEESDINFTSGFASTSRDTNIEQQGQSFFGQVEYELAPQWALSVGARQENIDQTGEQIHSSNGTYGSDMDSSEFLPKAALSYKLNSSNMLYVSYALGYMPGGYNYSGATDEDSFTYDPEYSTSIELGWKNTSLDQRLASSLTFFSVNTEDKQIVSTIATTDYSVDNIDDASTYGIELSLDYQVSPTLSVYANAGIQSTDTSSFSITQGVTTTNYTGNELPYSPNTTYSLGFSYGAEKGLFSNVAIKGSGAYYLDSTNTTEQEAYAMLDGDIGYQFDSLRASFWVTNLTDEVVYSRSATANSGIVVEDSDPRTIGIKLSKLL